MTIGTRLMLWLSADYMGSDTLGNRYYLGRRKNAEGKLRRFVYYGAACADPSNVPPMFHAWLHFMIDQFPDETMLANAPSWICPHEPNASGTASAYVSAYQRNPEDFRPRYEPWRPPLSK